MTRRAWVCAASGLAGCGAPEPQKKNAAPPPRPRIVWRTERGQNLADAARTLGMLRLLHVHIPEAQVTVWADEPGVDGDFLLHDGAGLDRDLAAWGGRPYGIFGARFASHPDARMLDLLRGAVFVFAEDTASLANLKHAGLASPRVSFAPDAGLSLKAASEPAAKEFLARYGLEPKQFLAMVQGPGASLAECAKLRAVSDAWVERTGRKVVLYPDDAAGRWSAEEAASILRRAAVVASLDPGAAVIAAANDTPVLYLRRSEDRTAGQLWKDIGLGGWLVDLDRVDAARVSQSLAAIWDDNAAAQVQVHEAVIFARKLQSDAMGRLRAALLPRPANAKKC